MSVADWAALLPGIAAIITALSGGAIGIIALTRGSKRERESSARHVIDRVLNVDDDEDDDQDRQDAIDAILKALEQKKGIPNDW